MRRLFVQAAFFFCAREYMVPKAGAAFSLSVTLDPGFRRGDDF